MFGSKYLHLIVADDDSDVSPAGIDNVPKFRYCLTAPRMPLAADFGRALLSETLRLAPADEFVERVGFALKVMARIRPIRLSRSGQSSGAIESMGPCDVPNPRMMSAIRFLLRGLCYISRS